jgi:ATP-dependent DNA ligase
MQLRDPVRAKRTRVAVYLYAFDVIYAGGFDLTRLALLERKLVLRRVLSFNRRLRFTAHRVGDGEQAWRDACANGLEGVIAKRADSPYEHGRSRDWLKFKCVNEQELVIGGYTEPASAPESRLALCCS